MDSIYKLISTYRENNNDWIYRNNKEVQSINIFDKSNSKHFIESYLGGAGTLPEPDSLAEVLEKDDYKTIDEVRYQHIVLTFFLGLIIYDKSKHIRKAIDKDFCNNEKYKDALEKHKDAPFAYIWFLICLFHDLGYQYENSKKEMGGKYSTFSDFLRDVANDVECIHNNLVGVPDNYMGMVEPYFNYRIKEMGKQDHGICGGIVLYRDLCNIRRKKEQRETKAVVNGFWKTELEQIFSYAASVVICHNMFFESKDSVLYKTSGLTGLMKDEGEYPIKIEEHPIFFLFCLVDSIEPIKVVKDVNLLKKITLTITDKTIKFDTTLNCGCADKLIRNFTGLNSWLCKVENLTIYLE